MFARGGVVHGNYFYGAINDPEGVNVLDPSQIPQVATQLAREHVSRVAIAYIYLYPGSGTDDIGGKILRFLIGPQLVKKDEVPAFNC